MLTLIWCATWLAFVQNFNHFDFQPLETLEWRLFLKISVYLQASLQPFIWARVAGPKSYLSEKFRTSKILDKWSPTSKLSDINFSHYPDGRYISFTCTRTCLSATPIKPVFWYLQIFFLGYMIEFWVLANMLTFLI